MNNIMSNITFRNKIENGDFFCVPGIQDMITAVIAKSIGFEAVYASGYWMGASTYGVPDVGITTYTQMLERVGTLVNTMKGTAVIADADTGYGGLLNVRETVRGYEAAGVQAIQIEDQQFPKKCGHALQKRVVSLETMVTKIKVAQESKTNSNTMIIARTDAQQSEGFEGAMKRMEAYALAGADIIFPEAISSEYEMREICGSINKPIMANMADGGNTPILSADLLTDIGFSFAIFPGTAALAAAAAVKKALLHLLATGTSVSEDITLFNLNEFSQLIGYDDVREFEERWMEIKQSPKG
jgi:2-methylisocitrate lyase-like PEP mutase family enzyme